METCYLCPVETPLIWDKDNPENSTASKEHIILNSIGGRLHSYKLLCKTCNSKFGQKCDKELSDQLSNLASLLQIKRERGDIQDIHATGEDGTIYILKRGYKPTIAQPKMVIDKDHISYSAANNRQMNKFLESVGRKNEDFDVQSAKEKIVNKTEYVNTLVIKERFGSPLAFQSIAKSAVNYYIHTTSDKEQVRHLFDYLRNIEPKDVAFHYHPKTPIYIKDEKDEVIHLIHMVGNKNSKMLYCYLEFFSSNCYIVKLSDNYTGKSFKSTYCYDVLKNEVLEKSIKLNLSRDKMNDIFNNKKNMEFPKRMEVKLTRVVKIARKIHEDIAVDNVVKEMSEQFISEYYVKTGDRPSLDEVCLKMAKTLMAYKLRDTSILE